MRALLLVLCAVLGTGCTCGKKKQAAPAAPVVAPAEPDASPKDQGRETAEWREVKKPAPPVPPPDVPPAAPKPDAGAFKPPTPLEVRSPADPFYESLERHSLVSVGAATLLTGNRDAQVVAAKLDAARKSMGICHQKALEERPDLAGSLIVDIEIDERGVIMKTSVVRNDVGAVADCVMRRMRAVKFGSGEPAKLRVPIELKAK